MDIEQHTQPAQLERYSFYWSEVRLVVAAVALFLGGIPPVVYLFPGQYSLTNPLLTLAWLVSGAASGYMIYRWVKAGKKLFGTNVNRDTYAFLVSVISGINLGVTGLTGNNIGMSLSSSRPIFLIVAVVYLLAAWHLWNRWNGSGKKLY